MNPYKSIYIHITININPYKSYRLPIASPFGSSQFAIRLSRSLMHHDASVWCIWWCIMAHNHQSSWGPIGIYGLILIYMELHSFIWICIDLDRSVLFLLFLIQLYWVLLNYIDLYSISIKVILPDIVWR